MSERIVAALDLGSNTFRLMLAERRGSLWVRKRVFQHLPRLSEKLQPGGRFSPEALARAWEALADLDEKIRQSGAELVMAGATMAARLAADGHEFMAEINRRYGWETVILKGEEEARLTALGVLSELEPCPQQGLIFDIGGRSTEFVPLKGRSVLGGLSLPLGVVGLTEAHLTAPAQPAQLEAVARDLRRCLREMDFAYLGGSLRLIGTAGTVTTVAVLLLGLKGYRPELVNNARLSREPLARLLQTVASETVEERVERHGLHPRRADAIVAGLVMVLEIMDFFQCSELVVSDNGVLEGLWLAAAGLAPRPEGEKAP